MLILLVDQKDSITEQSQFKHPFDQGNRSEAFVSAWREKAAIAEQEVSHIKDTKPNFFTFYFHFEPEVDQQVIVEKV